MGIVPAVSSLRTAEPQAASVALPKDLGEGTVTFPWPIARPTQKANATKDMLRRKVIMLKIVNGQMSLSDTDSVHLIPRF